MKRILLLLTLLFAATAPLRAQKRYTIDRFDSKMVVLKDGRLDVTETITATFHGSYNGIYRTLPLEYRNGHGFNWSIKVEFLGAADDQGRPLRTELSYPETSLKFKMWVPGANDATRTVVLHYIASNGLRFLEDHDELYWNATGDEWDVALGMVTASVTLPEGASGVRTAALNGVYGAIQKDAQIETAGRTTTFTMPHPLAFREGMTVVVGWDKGLIPPPSAADKVLAFLKDNWPMTVPIPVFVLMFFLWYTRGRDPRLRPIMAQYEPPREMTPSEAGTITDESVDMRDITACLVDLAVRGFLKIEEHQGRRLLGIFGGGTDYTFVRSRPASAWSVLALHERRVLEGIFDGGSDRVDLSDLTNRFYEDVPGIQNAVMERLVSKGYYRARPDTLRNAWRGAGVVLGFLMAMGGSAIAVKFGLTPVPFVVGGILSGLIILGFGQIMPARTDAGTRALEQVLGYEDFLARVDSDRFARVVKTPEMFEQGLAYAMALGVERQWSRAFADIYRNPPNWYVGSNMNGFNAMMFTNNLSMMTHQANSTMSSQPRSSSGSGFGGGGSSGGGGGGGGGGAF